MTYYFTSIMTNLLLRELEHDAKQSEQHEAENEKYAVQCCQSFSYMQQFKFIGSVANAVGLQISLLVFRDQARRSWIVQRLQDLAASRAAVAKKIPPHNPDDGIPGIRIAVQQAESMII